MKQLLTFCGLAFFISWIIWFPLYAPSFGIDGLPVVPLHHAWGAFGPLIASLITTYIYNGRLQVINMVRKMFHPGRTLYLLIALLSPFVLLYLALCADGLLNGTATDWNAVTQAKEFPGTPLAIFFLYNLFFFGFGEEAGWRGFVLPRLQEKMNALQAACALTVLWALWHAPLFLYRPGYMGMDMAGITGWVMSLLTGSILLTWLYNSTAGNILVCAVFHSTIDVAFTANFSGSSVTNYLGLLVTIWGIAVILIFKPSRLSLHPKVTHPVK